MFWFISKREGKGPYTKSVSGYSMAANKKAFDTV